MRITSNRCAADLTKIEEQARNRAELASQVTHPDKGCYTEARLAELWQRARWQSGMNVKWVESA
jgi:hypothetical protein